MDYPTKVANRKIGKLNIVQVAFLIGTIVEVYNKLLPNEKKEAMAMEYVPAYPQWLLTETGSADTVNVHHRVITWDITRRENGTIGERAFSEPKSVRPSIREEIPTTREDGSSYVVEVYGKFYDNLLRFDCFAPTSIEAHETLLRFERMIEIHAKYLEAMGASKVVYWGRTSPVYLNNTRYHNKSCLWYVKTEEMWSRDEDSIKRIELEVNSELETELERFSTI